MEFSIKYSCKDYSQAFKYHFRKVIIEEKKDPNSFIYKLFLNTVTFFVCLYHKIGKLRHTYNFAISEESLTREHNGQSGTIGWDRVFSYLNHPKFFQLDLEHGSVLIPKRILKSEWITKLENILVTNQIEQKALVH